MDVNSLSPELLQIARNASNKAYSPYSRFPVGCVIITKKGGKFTGCNIENISFGLTMCAERVALFKAISEEGPEMEVAQIYIYTPTNIPISPCGACRQVIYEFGKNAEIFSFCDTDTFIQGNIQHYLPSSPDIRL